MIKQSVLKNVVELQQERLNETETGHKRDLLSQLTLNLPNHALIISGIRRCGKSTLLHQLIEAASEKVFFLNFDTPKLYNFEIEDFEISKTEECIICYESITNSNCIITDCNHKYCFIC